MARIILEEILNDLSADSLPANWSTFNYKSFSKDKTLWKEQQRALEASVKLLWKYYEDYSDYSPNEKPDVNKERRSELYKWYRSNGLEENVDLTLSRNSITLLEEYFPIEDDTLEYKHLINRCCFWMATGSGKTLVIVKLIEILWNLIRRNEIPSNDILILTYRDDLIEHLKRHVQEFNAFHANIHIKLHELRDYADVKRSGGSLFKNNEVVVFYYRSDNVSDEQKEKIIDFRNYDDNGKWYVLLDEAHKGDREDSKRQHIYSILARNGFLFNFSATFTDQRDVATTASNFNLSEFLKAGYGKHIAILEQELRAFRDKEDFTNDEKQKIVLKSLLMLAYVQASSIKVEKIQKGLFHKPLLLTLVNSVNTEEADLKIFFAELERIAKGKVSASNWRVAKEELWEELKKKPPYFFEEGKLFEANAALFDKIDLEWLREHVFYSKGTGDIEVLVRPSNKQEIAFKLKTTDRPFALIRIGDISNWLKETLAHYEVLDSFEDEGFFENLNKEESDINILMGSRSFYEGWDSNRPNVINFINIGTGIDAKKFILQSIGRGVRIEPIKNKRKRLMNLANSDAESQKLYEKLGRSVDPLESLFIFGTNRSALKTVIEHLEVEGGASEHQQISLFINEEVQKRHLLVPVYKESNRTLMETENRTSYSIDKNDLDVLNRYSQYIDDDRVFMAVHNADPASIDGLRQSLQKSEGYFKADGKSIRNINVLVSRIMDYFGIVPKEFDRLKKLEDEISHFKNVVVSVSNIAGLREKVEKVHKYKDPKAYEDELDNKLERKKISLAAYKKGMKEIGGMVKEEIFEYDSQKILIKQIANHYYIPIIVSDERERIKYIKHIIQNESEIKFLEHLEKYLATEGNLFNEFDWWMFSKLDETLDNVYVPWYDAETNKIRRFNPDFIFWLQKGKKYWIVFIDPKGTVHTDYQHKIDGFIDLFEDQKKTKIINHEGISVHIKAFLRTENLNMVSREYKRFWFDGIEKVLERIIA